MSRRAGWRVGVVALLMLVCREGMARADVYVVRGPSGAIVLTNVPAVTEEGTSERVYAEAEQRSEVAMATAFDRGSGWQPSFTPTRDDGRYDVLIRDVADRHDLEFALVKAVMRAESGFDPVAI